MTERGAFAISAALLVACVVFLGMWKPLISPDFWMKDGNLTSIIGGLGGGFCTIVAGWLALIVGKRSLDRIAEQIQIQREELGYLREQLDLQRADLENQLRQREAVEAEDRIRKRHILAKAKRKMGKVDAALKVFHERAAELAALPVMGRLESSRYFLPPVNDILADPEAWRIPHDIRQHLELLDPQIIVFNECLAAALARKALHLPDGQDIRSVLDSAYRKLATHQVALFDPGAEIPNA